MDEVAIVDWDGEKVELLRALSLRPVVLLLIWQLKRQLDSVADADGEVVLYVDFAEVVG